MNFRKKYLQLIVIYLSYKFWVLLFFILFAVIIPQELLIGIEFLL